MAQDHQSTALPTKTVNLQKLPAGNNRGLQQAYDIRDFTANMLKALQADILKDGSIRVVRDEYGKPVDAAAVSQLVKAWSEACDRIRILRNRPLPGSLKPEAKARVKKPIVFEPINEKPPTG